MHQKGHFNMDSCCFSMMSPEVGLENGTQHALLRAASRELEANEGTKKLAQNYTKSDEEGPIEVRDVNHCRSVMKQTSRKVLPIVMIQSPLFLTTMPGLKTP
jgi:hypothetical protein